MLFARSSRSEMPILAVLTLFVAGATPSLAQTTTLSSAALTGSRQMGMQIIPNTNQVPTAAQFAGARAAASGFPIPVNNNPWWLTALPGDPAARWFSSIPNGDLYTASSMIVAIPFEVICRQIGSCSLTLTFTADDGLGSAGCSGIFCGPDGQMPTAVASPGTLGNYHTATTFSSAATLNVATGRNYLYLIVNSDLGGPGGIMFTGSVTVNRGPNEVVIDTDARTISNLNVSYTATTTNDNTEFRIPGDLAFSANHIVSVVGSRPARIVVGGNLNIPAGCEITASGIASRGFAGGGSGGGPGIGAEPAPFVELGNPGSSIAGTGGIGGRTTSCLFVNGSNGVAGAGGSSYSVSVANPGNVGGRAQPGTNGYGIAPSTLAPQGGPGATQRSIGASLEGAPGGGGDGGYSSGGNGGGGWTGQTVSGLSGNKGDDGLQGNLGRSIWGTNTSVLFAGGGGSGGSGGGSGGTGGRGYHGSGGGGGGGGGATSCVWGGNGGSGGHGGIGGIGGLGGRGGQGGTGGGGGGYVDFLVLGKLIGSGTVSSKGGGGSPGYMGLPGQAGSPGSGGSPGSNGQSGTASSGSGGPGAAGGAGGVGGTGGTGGNGGVGGRGAGGCIRMLASSAQNFGGVFNTENDPLLPGINGRTQTAFNDTAASMTVRGGNVLLDSTSAPRAANPHLSGSPSTPYLPDLVDGPAPFGFLSLSGATNFFPGRPSTAIMGFARLSVPPSGFPVLAGFDYCIIGNLSAAPLVNPMLGIGASATALRRGGRDADPNLGSNFATVPTLPPGSVWITQMPSTTAANTNIAIQCTLGVAAGGSGAAALNAPIYVSAPAVSRLFVDCTAPAGGNGLAWNSAFSDLQSAVAAASSLTTGGEISVAGGLYTPDIGFGQTPGSTASAFNLPPGITVRGGYAGRASATPDNRDTTLYRTVLSGDLAKDDDSCLLFPGGYVTGIPSSITGNHSFTVSLWLSYQAQSLNQWAVYMGTFSGEVSYFSMQISPNGTCRSGLSYDWTNSINLGAPGKWVHLATSFDAPTRTIRSYLNGQLVATNTNNASWRVPNLTGNFRLGLVEPELDDLNYSGKMREVRVWNTARSQEGIVADMIGSTTGNEPNLVAHYPLNTPGNVTIPDLAPADGANNLGVYSAATLQAGSRTDNAGVLTTVNFTSASAGLSSLQLSDATSAAVNLAGSNAVLTIDDALVSSNSGQNVIAANVAGNTLTITDTIFTANTNNGRVIRSTAAATIDRCIAYNNNSEGFINQFGGAPGSVSNTLIANGGWGRLISADGSPLTLSNCTIVNTSTTNPLTLHSNGGTISMRNCVFSGNAGAIAAATDVQYSLLQQAMPGNGNKVAAPQFVNAAALDFRLAAGSPGIDAGNSGLVASGTTIDLAGNPRIADVVNVADTGVGCPVVDMGAFESPGIQPVAPVIGQSPMDKTITAGGTLTLAAAVTGGSPTPTLSWTRNGQPLVNGPSAGGGTVTINGALLTIVNAGTADSGSYVFRAASACRVATSAAAAVVVQASACIADFNQNGATTIDDIFVYLNAWFAGCDGTVAGAPCSGRNADVNDSGNVSIDDIFVFLNHWFAGC